MRFNNGNNVTYLVLFTIVLLIKLSFLRIVLFEDYNIVTTLRSELLYIFLFLLVIELAARKGKVVTYLLFNLIMSGVFFSFIVYTAYFGTLPSHYDLNQLGQVGSVSDSIAILIQPSYLLFFVDFLFLIPILILLKRKNTQLFFLKSRSLGILVILCLSGLILNFVIHKDERIIDTMATAEKKGIFTYEILQYFQDLQKAGKARSFNNEDIVKIKGTKIVGDGKKHFGEAKDKNLIIVQLESFQDFIINASVGGEEITPHLNQLIKESYYYNNVFQQIGAGNTSDAEFLVNTSLYPAGLQATSKAYGDKQIPGLPRILNNKGYQTATFHTGEVTYWYRDQLYPALGFNKYYDRSYFGEKDIVGSFGPSDDVLYKGAIDVMESYVKDDERFYTHLVSLTSHSPFIMPDDKAKLNLPPNYQTTFFGHYLESAHYADQALGRFIEQLKNKGIWEDSVVVFYGDHSGLHGKLLKPKDVKLISDLLGYHYSKIDRYNIPLIIHTPSNTEGKVIDQVGGQIDIMPTVANFMGLDLENHIHFGQDLTNSTNNLFGMRYYLPTGTFFNEEVLYVASAEDEGKPEVYSLKTTKETTRDPDHKKDFEKMFELYDLNDAYLWGLPER
ncbi:LTA synthase family protein [Rossellomorea arthrocnemi]